MKKIIMLLGVLCLLLILVLPCYASPWQIRSGDEVIEKGQVIEGDLLFSGDRVQVNGTIKGDLVVLAGEVIINGRVEGDLLGVVWGKASINGVVQGNVRALSGEIKLAGKINGCLTVASVMLNSTTNSLVEKGILGLFSKFALKGTVNGPVDVNSALTTIGGRINGDLKIHGAPIIWQAPAEVTGKVNDYSGVSSEPAKIKGVTIGRGYQLQREKVNLSPFYNTLTLISIIWIIGSLLATLILYRFFPRTFWIMTEPSPVNFRKSFFVGLVSFFAIPLFAVISILTVVGIPLAILLGLVYLILLLFSGIPLNLWFGRLIFKSGLHPSLMIVFGGFILMFLNFIPVVNLFLSFISILIGFGMIVGNIKPQFYDRKRVDLKA